MDALRRDDIAIARSTPTGEKLAQALELMRLGIAVKREQIQSKFPGATGTEVDGLLREWLAEPR